jgi:hypothetical protein
MVSVTLPSTLRSVAVGAFCACMSLRSAELPAACEEVGDRAFWMCAGMETVSISAALTVIQTGTFMDCTALVRVAIPADAALNAARLERDVAVAEAKSLAAQLEQAAVDHGATLTCVSDATRHHRQTIRDLQMNRAGTLAAPGRGEEGK